MRVHRVEDRSLERFGLSEVLVKGQGGFTGEVALVLPAKYALAVWTCPPHHASIVAGSVVRRPAREVRARGLSPVER